MVDKYIWYVRGQAYTCAKKAAEANGVTHAEVFAWCGHSKNELHQKRRDCWTVLRYMVQTPKTLEEALS